MSRVGDKIEEIEKYLDELTSIVPEKWEEYQKDKVIRAACERYFEKIVEAVTDLAFLIIALKKLDIPQDDVDAFKILLDNKIIKEELCNKLKQAKGMRNILAHQYGVVDDSVVFEALKNEIESDVNQFLNKVKKF